MTHAKKARALLGVQRRAANAQLAAVLEDVLAETARLTAADGVRFDDPDGRPRQQWGELSPILHTMAAPVLTLHSNAGSLVAVRTRGEPFAEETESRLVLLAEVLAAALLAEEAEARDQLAAMRAETLTSLYASAEQLRAIFTSNPLGVALVDGVDLRLLRTNAALSALTGRAPADLAEQTFPDLVPVAERDECVQWLRCALAGPGSASREQRLLGPSGEPLWCQLFVARVEGSAGGQLVMQVEDISVQWQARQLLSRLAHTDPLTGLANRLEVERQLDSALSRDGDEKVGLVYLDLDGFKEVNDRLGHGAGDELLLTVAERLAASVRPRDVVGRMGGDEFVVVVDHLVDLAELERLRERIRRAVGRTVDLSGGQRVRVTASLGSSTARPNEAPQDLICRADEQMYIEKRRSHATRKVRGPRESAG